MLVMLELERIRKMYFREGLSAREINRCTGIHRKTIAKYLSKDNTAIPKYVLSKEKKRPVLEAYIPMIEQILKEDQERHRKQRHTGAKIFETLKRNGYQGGYTTITDYLRNKHKKVREAFLPLEFELGTYAEVDWVEAYFFLKGKETKAHVFSMKLRGSGGFYAVAYPFEKQEAFFDAHIKCFKMLGGVPYKIAYDNLKTAVNKVLKGTNREEQDQFIALRTHYLFDAVFCQVAKGSEKGGVENANKYILKNIFVPYPNVDSFGELNHYLHEECMKRLVKNPKWEAEKSALRTLPNMHFEAARFLEVKVNKYSMVQFETNKYSLPTNYVGEKVTIKAMADTVTVTSKDVIIAIHPRLYGRNQENIILDHYLELLSIKPRAIANTKVYKPQALPPIYEVYRKCLLMRTDAGNKEFIKILMLHRNYSLEMVTEALELADAYNVYGYDGVLNIIHQIVITGTPKIAPLSPNMLNDIPTVSVKKPDLDKFNILLSGGIH